MLETIICQSNSLDARRRAYELWVQHKFSEEEGARFKLLRLLHAIKSPRKQIQKFLLEELAELSKLLVLASRAPHVAQLVPVLARVVRLCGSAQPRADRSSESSRQPEPITAILDALGALLASPHDAVFAAAGESLEAIARRLGEAPTQASPPQPLVGIRALEASTAPLAALDCLLGTCVEFRQRILCQLLSVISRRSAVVCTALVQERALQLLDAVAAPAATSATTITAAPLHAPAAAAADPDSDDEPLSTPPADGLPNEEEGLLLGKTKHGRGQSAPPQLVAARIERARTALHSAPPHRAAQSASPRPAAVEGGAVVIAIDGNQQTYRLDGVTLGQLSMTNIEARNEGARAEWRALLDAAEPAPTVSVADASVTEGDAGTAALSFVVTLSAPSDGTVEVDWSTFAGTARAGEDYVPALGTLVFAAGETRKTVTVDVTGDALHERDETFGLRLAAARGARVWGECGGYMTLGEGLIDAEGARHAMLGLLPLETSFAARRLTLGYRRLRAREGLGWPAAAGERLSAHEFHYASILREGDAPRVFDATDAAAAPLPAMGLRVGRVAGSFAHLIGPGR